MVGGIIVQSSVGFCGCLGKLVALTKSVSFQVPRSRKPATGPTPGGQISDVQQAISMPLPRSNHSNRPVEVSGGVHFRGEKPHDCHSSFVLAGLKAITPHDPPRLWLGPVSR